MEDMVNDIFGNIYKGRKVLITGVLGFKGSWLAYWLQAMGAEVMGYSLRPSQELSHFPLLNLPCSVVEGDIRNAVLLQQTLESFQPSIVFHLAAQPLVRLSYREPLETFETNVMGTLGVFEACRKTASVRAILNVTSDKCYDNKEWVWGYRETDPMGGYDPYSASKGCAELLTASYRNSYFHPDQYGKVHSVLLASVRAGNVIGGGDWAEDRIIPDLVKAASSGAKLEIRNRAAYRPWQHVLDPLSGYLQVGQKLLEGDTSFSEGFNFGPMNDRVVTVGEIADYFSEIFDINLAERPVNMQNVHEAVNLKLDCSKAFHKLQWYPVWNVSKTLDKTAAWYKMFLNDGIVNTKADLHEYISDAKTQELAWTRS